MIRDKNILRTKLKEASFRGSKMVENRKTKVLDETISERPRHLFGLVFTFSMLEMRNKKFSSDSKLKLNQYETGLKQAKQRYKN